MKRAIIFANGEIINTIPQCIEIRPDDLIIAADGGALHCHIFGLKPHVVIGDFDSLSEDDLRAFEADGALLIRHPTHKDETDLELAYQYAQQEGCQEILLIAALGERWDMSLSNILLAAHPPYNNLQVRLLEDHQELQLLHGGESLVLEGQPGDTLSLIPLSSQAHGITTQGLEYTLKNDDLMFGSARGISNVFTSKTAIISLREGLLICVVIRKGDSL